MVKNQNIIILLLVAVAAFAGCTKEEEPDHFRYTVNDYPLQQGFIHNFGILQGSSGYNFDVTLFSSGISYDRYREEFQGFGNMVFLQMFSSSATELANGTYQFSTDETNGQPSTFNTGNFAMNLRFSDGTGTIVSAVSGVVRVSSGMRNEIVIDFDCMTSTGEKITGHFSGSIPVYDMRFTRK
jgi:hypothetical protein